MTTPAKKIRVSAMSASKAIKFFKDGEIVVKRGNGRHCVGSLKG